MNEVLKNLSRNPKHIARLADVWTICSGYDAPRYVDAKTLFAGQLGMFPWSGDDYLPTVDNHVFKEIASVGGGPMVPDISEYIWAESGATHEGQTAYESTDGAYWLWWDTANWVISTAKGTKSGNYWTRATTIDGAYTAQGTAVGDPTIGDLTATIQDGDYYSLVVVAEDLRFVSQSGTYRKSIPTSTATSLVLSAAGEGLRWTIPVHPQNDYDNSSGTPTSTSAATRRRVYVASSSVSAAAAKAATHVLAGTIDNNTQVYYDLVADPSSTTTPDYTQFPPANCRFCVSDYNYVWMAGGIIESRGLIALTTDGDRRKLTGVPVWDIVKIVDDGINPAVVYAPGHDYSNADSIVIAGTTNYDGTYSIGSVDSEAGTFTITTDGTRTEYPYDATAIESGLTLADRTYFFDGFAGAKVSIDGGPSYVIDEVDVGEQILWLSEDETVTEANAPGYSIRVESEYGLRWSAVANPHWWPVTNYVLVPGRVRGLFSVHKDLYVFLKDDIYKYNSDAPEQGPFHVSGGVGTNAPNSIVEWRGQLFFWDGQGFSTTDGVRSQSITREKIMDLLDDVNIDESYRIQGVYDPKTDMIQFYYPKTGETALNYGIEYNPGTGDIYPFQRFDVSTVWQQDRKVYVATTGRHRSDKKAVVWEVDHDWAADGIETGKDWTGLITDDAITATTFIVNTGIGSYVSDMKAFPWSVVKADGTTEVGEILTHSNVNANLTINIDSTLWSTGNLEAQDRCFIGVLPMIYGPKWHDFGSPRYDHKTYDIQFHFEALEDTCYFYLDWYRDLGASIYETKSEVLTAGDVEAVFRYDGNPTKIIGFRIRLYSAKPVKLQHYTVTWGTLR